MMCPPERVKMYGTPSRLSARATTRRPCIGIVLRSELDRFDVGDALAHVLGELLLDARLDLADALARDAELVPDLLQRHRLLVAHERRQPPLVDDQVFSLERLLERARRLADEAMILLVGDRVGSLLGAG